MLGFPLPAVGIAPTDREGFWKWWPFDYIGAPSESGSRCPFGLDVVVTLDILIRLDEDGRGALPPKIRGAF